MRGENPEVCGAITKIYVTLGRTKPRTSPDNAIEHLQDLIRQNEFLMIPDEHTEDDVYL